MKVDLNKSLFVKLKFVEARRDNCKQCIFCTQDKNCLAGNVPCNAGHWELAEVLETAFDMQQIQDSINSVGAKISQVKSEIHQINEEVKEEPKYFY